MNNDTKTSNFDIIQDLTLMDDPFMTVFFENEPACVEDVLDAILPFKATVQNVETQYDYHNLYGRSVTFDIFAKDSNNTAYDIEIQKLDKGANPKRARFHSSMLDTKSLKKGEDFYQINDTYVIFITENDVLGGGKPIYRIERKIDDSDKYFDDGSHIIYVNTSYKGTGSNAIETLINDFNHKESECIKNRNLYRRYKELKTHPTQKEVDKMSKLLDMRIQMERAESRAEGRAEGRAESRAETSKEIAKNMLITGEFTVDKIAALCQLTVDEVNELQEQASA